MTRQRLFSLGLLMLPCCAQGGDPFTPADTNEEFGELGGGCYELGVSYPISPAYFVCGSYENRSFLSPRNHVACDFAVAEETPVYAMTDGRIVWYGPASGYGELVVVVETTFGEPIAFRNGGDTSTRTSTILVITGHLRNARTRGGTPLAWRVGDMVHAGDLIGFVNDDAHNGDGLPHVHCGTRLMSMSDAMSADPGYWFRGYDNDGRYRHQFASPIHVFETLNERRATCTTDEPPTVVPLLDFSWRTPGGVSANTITLSGMRSVGNAVIEPWHEMTVTSGSSVENDVELNENEVFDFSVEFRTHDETHWSCEGGDAVRGTVEAVWSGRMLAARPVPNGVGGCNLRISADAPIESNNEPPPASLPDSETPPSDTPPSDTPPEPSDNTINCAASRGNLDITVQGAISSALIGGPQSDIGFISIGSEATGWETGTTPPAAFTIYNGDSYPHIVRVPDSVRRFNLWVGGASGARWFDLARWSAVGECIIASDGASGLIVTR